MVRCTLILVLSIVFVPVVFASSIKDLINEQSKISPNISISIKNITKNKMIVSHRYKARMTPASNQKILTTLTGLEFLGPNYKFQTHIYFIDPIDDSGIYKGGSLKPRYSTESASSHFLQWLGAESCERNLEKS